VSVSGVSPLYTTYILIVVGLEDSSYYMVVLKRICVYCWKRLNHATSGSSTTLNKRRVQLAPSSTIDDAAVASFFFFLLLCQFHPTWCSCLPSSFVMDDALMSIDWSMPKEAGCCQICRDSLNVNTIFDALLIQFIIKISYKVQ